MKKITCIILLFFTGIAFGQDFSCTVKKDVADKNLKENEAIITFNFSGVDWSKMEMMSITVDSVEKRVRTKDQSYTMKISPGYHDMIFWYWAEYSRPAVDSVLIKPAHRVTMNVHFQGVDSFHPFGGGR